MGPACMRGYCATQEQFEAEGVKERDARLGS
jgi:hypothetical protein